LTKGTRCKLCGYFIEVPLSNLKFCTECNGTKLEESEKRETDVPAFDEKMHKLMSAKVDWYFKQQEMMLKDTEQEYGKLKREFGGDEGLHNILPSCCPRCESDEYLTFSFENISERSLDFTCNKCQHKWIFKLPSK